MIALTNIERAWATSALTTIFPSGVHARVRGADVIDIGASLEEVCQSVPARVALGLRAAVWLFAFAPLWFFRMCTLPHVDVEMRERIVLSLLSSRVYVVRQLAVLLKAFGALMFVAAAGVREGIVKREAVIQIGLGARAGDRHVA
jgi:hypothetical protein